jgi:formylmethanofuran dehydrogenase subunit C
VSDAVVLTFRGGFDAPLRLDVIQPSRWSGLSKRDIASLPVMAGRHATQLGELFEVKGGHSSLVRVIGSTASFHGLGSGMTGGELIVEGNAGHDAGCAMSGGVLRIEGNAGDRTGGATPGAARGITGGEIVVSGSVGRETGVRARRGLIAVGGSTGPDPARAMIAGTLIVLGACGERPGQASKRGTIVACGAIDVPVTYRYACTYYPPHLRLTFTYLQRRHRLADAPAVIDSAYSRYWGDAGAPGKGEILQMIDL